MAQEEHIPRPKGHPALAELTSLDGGLMIYKRFGELNAHSLLFQQAHLLKLEDDLKCQQEADREDHEEYNKDVRVLIEKRAEQWKIHVESRQRLRIYRECRCR